LTAVDEADNTAASEPVSVAVAYPPQIKIKEVPKEITITETDRGLLVSLTSRVLFDTAQSTLKPTANKTLQELVKVLNAYDENKISVEGHTDSVGSDGYNQQLSERRAQSVARYLIKAGISADRISVKGWGEAHPAATNATAAGREANRRVEVIILK
jgi:outer membrane protein OmpA-like peptidoglycan-associated protein